MRCSFTPSELIFRIWGVCVRWGFREGCFLFFGFLFEASALATCEILLNQPDFVVVNKHHLPKTTTYLSVTPSDRKSVV